MPKANVLLNTYAFHEPWAQPWMSRLLEPWMKVTVVALSFNAGDTEEAAKTENHHQRRVLLQGHNRKPTRPVIVRQVGSLQNMQQLELDSAAFYADDMTDGIQHLCAILSRKAQNHMGDGVEPHSVEPLHRLVIDL